MLQLITGLGVTPGNLQKALVEASPQGILDAGKDILSGKMGAFDGASAINSLANKAITSVTDELESVVRTSLASNSNLNTVISTISAVDANGNITRSSVTSSRIGRGETDSAEFNEAILKNKTNPLADLSNIVKDSGNIKQNLKKAGSDLENLSGGKDSKTVLNSVTGSAEARNTYTTKGDEYRSLIQTKVAKGSQTGIIQGISTEVLSDVKKRVRDFAPKLTDEQTNRVVNLSQGDAGDISEAVRLLYDATGKSFDSIRQLVKSIDTTIDNATRVTPSEALSFLNHMLLDHMRKSGRKVKANPFSLMCHPLKNYRLNYEMLIVM